MASSSSASPPPSSSSSLLERAFESIRSGNDLEAASRPWVASERFAEAASILDRLARGGREGEQEAELLRDKECEEDETSGDEKRVAALYAHQSREYLVRSRSVLLRALREEHEGDKSEVAVATDPPPEHDEPVSGDRWRKSKISEEELDRRTRLFAALFARPLAEARREAAEAEPGARASAEAASSLPPVGDKGDGADDAAEKAAAAAEAERSIEERWRRLNENLPKALQTEEQRMARINRGLNKLGLSSVQPSYGSGASPFRASMPPDVGAPRSEAEQVDDLIAQAADEARVMAAMHPSVPQIDPLGGDLGSSSQEIQPLGAGGSDAGDSDTDDDTEDDDEDSEYEDCELTPEQVATLRDHVATAQAELAQLSALLQPDEGGDAEIEFDPASGRHHLSRARAALKRAACDWK
jgi:hypothetical protein